MPQGRSNVRTKHLIRVEECRYKLPTFILKIETMKFFKKLKQHLGGCEHQWVIRYDDREDLDDAKHTFRVTLCRECGKVKSIEEIA